MDLRERQARISALEDCRDSRVLVYFLADRTSQPQPLPGFVTSLSSEPQLLISDLVRGLGDCENLDLFLYTRGGETNSVWPLVSILREHCKRLTVIVPFRAHSGGTLVCFGADEVILTDRAELSPIDPRTANPFNSVDEKSGERIPISVEDVTAFFQLAEERAKIKDEPYEVEVLKELTSRVHPLALGNVQRVYMQIRKLAEELLKLHMDGEAAHTRIKCIVEAFTEKFYSHSHAISRTEAIPLCGDWMRPPDSAETKAIDALFEAYADTLELRNRFSLAKYMGDEPVKDLPVTGAVLETSGQSYSYVTELKVLQRPQLPPGVQMQLPPNQPPPLLPWFQRSYDVGVTAMGWRRTEEDHGAD